MLTVRPIADGDVGQFRAWRGDDPYKDEIALRHLAAHRSGDRIVFVAVDGATVVGTLQLVFTDDDPELADERSCAHLLALDVKQPYRRRGIGTRLVATAEEAARERGLARLTVAIEPDNAPSFGLFASLGYAAFKRSSFVWRGETLATVCLEKALGGGRT